MRFQHGGTTLLTVWSDGKIIRFDTTTGKKHPIATIPPLLEFRGLHTVGMSRDGTKFAISYDVPKPDVIRTLCGFRVYATNSGAMLCDFGPFEANPVHPSAFIHPRNEVVGLDFFPDCKRVVAGFEDGNICELDISKRRCLSCFPVHTSYLNDLCCSPDGTSVALVLPRPDTTVTLADTITRSVLWSTTLEPVPLDWNLERSIKAASDFTPVAFSLDGKLLAIGSKIAGMFIIDTRNGSIVAKFLESTFVEILAFAPDGNSIEAGCRDNGIYVVDIGSGKIVQRLEGPIDGFYKPIVFTSSGKKMAARAKDGTIRMWTRNDLAMDWRQSTDLPEDRIAY
jgi:WD40 repeat protein